MGKPLVVHRWKGLQDFLKGVLFTLVVILVLGYGGYRAGVLVTRSPAAWYVDATTCAPKRALSLDEERAWTAACLVLWDIAGRK